MAEKKVYFNKPQRLTQLIGANTTVIGTAVRNSVLTSIGLLPFVNAKLMIKLNSTKY